MTATIGRCQWDGCPAIATHTARRGETAMPPMRLCARHLAQFRELPDLEAFRISAERQPEQRRQINRHSSWAFVEAERGGDNW